MGNPGEIDDAIAAADAALAAIGAMTDSQARLEAAGKLADELRSRSDSAARIRRDEAVRIYKAESLSLAQLADRTGVSKARADQFVRAEKRAEEQREEAGDVRLHDRGS